MLPSDCHLRCIQHADVTWPGCQVDEEVDADTPNAGEYRFEKMVSGLYMGEVARRVILHLAVGVPSRIGSPSLLLSSSGSKSVVASDLL